MLPFRRLSVVLCFASTLGIAEHAPAPKDHSKIPLQKWDPVVCANVDFSEARVRETVEKAIKPFLKKTQRKVYFYHYGWRSPRYPQGAPAGVWDDSVSLHGSGGSSDFQGPLDPDLTIVGKDGVKRRAAEEYFRLKASAQFEAPKPEGVVGGGLYTASDPLASIVFSGKNDLLLRVGVPEGTAFLDLRNRKNRVPVDRAAMDRVNCYLWSRNKAFSKFFKDGFEYFDPKDFLFEAASRAFLKEIYRDLKIAFIEQRWGAPQFEAMKLDRGQDLGGPVFIDPDFSKSFEIDALVPQLEKNPPPAKRKLYSDTLRFFEAFDTESSYSKSLPQGPLQGEAPEKFWKYYTAWAPVLRDVPAGKDLKEFQKEQLRTYKGAKMIELLNEIYGGNPDFAQER